MKICFFTEHYPPMDGGIATSAQRISNNLKKLGNSVTVFTFDNTKKVDVPDYCNVFVENDMEIYKFGPFFAKNKNIDKAHGEATSERDKAILRRRVLMQMYEVAQDKNFDIILSLCVINAGFMAQFLGNMLHIPVVVGARGNDVGTNLFDTTRFAVVKYVLESSKYIIAVNHHLKKRMEMACPALSNKIVVIKNAVNYNPDHHPMLESKNGLIKRCGWNSNDLIIAFAGSMREKKGTGPLLQALKIVNEQLGNKIRFLLIGPNVKDKDVEKVTELWEELKEQNLVFVTGQVERNEVPNWYMCADIVVMPSIEDGMSNGLLEGMEVGLCPIATTIFSDVIQNEKTGLLVETNNAVELANAMKKLYFDRKMLENYGKAAREYIKNNHNAMDEAIQYEKILKEVYNEYSESKMIDNG